MSEYDLRKSTASLGKLVPVLKDKHGNVIDGLHRLEWYPDWPVVVCDWIDTTEKLEAARLACNTNRRTVKPEELSMRITLLTKAGLKADQIEEMTGLSKTTIYKYMPQELKDEKKAESGKVGGIVSGDARSASPTNQTVKTQDTAIQEASLHKVAPKVPDVAQAVKCERCTVETTVPKPWHGHVLCSKCFERAEGNPVAYDGYFKMLERGKAATATRLQIPVAKPLTPSSVEPYSDKVARMQTPHSRMEEKIVNKLRAKGYTVETDIPVTVKEIITIPDFNIILVGQKTVRGYVDGVVHNGKRRDKDDDLRLLLKKRFPNDVIVAVDVKGDSDKEADEKIAEIEEALKW